ncbi:ATP binding protein [Aureococcus anophagefferens]|nr:ATP binding protein [Aureococcus anophagefferens]
MRPLREVALVFQFRKVPHNLRLASRLKAVAAGERVDVSPAAISALADASLGDVRAAIHALQAPVGGASEAAALLGDVLSGDAGRVVAGVHENYVQVPYHDSSLDKASGLLEDLSVADAFLGTAHRRGHFELAPYAGAAAGLAAFSRMRVDQVPKMAPPTKHGQLAATRVADLAAVGGVGQRGAAASGASAPSSARRTSPRRCGASCSARASARSTRPAPGARAARAHGGRARGQRPHLRAPPGPVDGAVPLVAQWHLRPDVSAASRFGGVEEEPVAPFLKQLLAKQVMLHKVRQREALLERDAPPAPAPGPAAPPAKARLGKGADDTKLLLAAAAKAHAPADKPAFSFAAWGSKRARPPSALAANKRANTDAAA